MAQTTTIPEPLYTGTRMELEEFIRRWEALPDLKNAELIEGIVFVASPVSLSHGSVEAQMALLLGVYASRLPGAVVATNTTCYMLGSSPQPDVFLMRQRAGLDSSGKYPVSAPELIVEISESSIPTTLDPSCRCISALVFRNTLRLTR